MHNDYNKVPDAVLNMPRLGGLQQQQQLFQQEQLWQPPWQPQLQQPQLQRTGARAFRLPSRSPSSCVHWGKPKETDKLQFSRLQSYRVVQKKRSVLEKTKSLRFFDFQFFPIFWFFDFSRFHSFCYFSCIKTWFSESSSKIRESFPEVLFVFFGTIWGLIWWKLTLFLHDPVSSSEKMTLAPRGPPAWSSKRYPKVK